MRKTRRLATLAILALTLVPAGLYAQRSRGGGAGVGGGGFRGNSGNTEGIRPSNAPVTRPANGVANPGNPEPKGPNQKAAENKAPQNKVAAEIGKDPGTQKNVERLLPIDMTLDEASAGFKNRGQFISTLHASKNLNIPFSDLKSRITGSDSMSLGKSIHSLRPDLSDNLVDAEAKKAEKQAKDTEKGT